MCSLDLASKDPEEMRWSQPLPSITPFPIRSMSRWSPRTGRSEGCADEDHRVLAGHSSPSSSPPAPTTPIPANPERWTGYNGSHVWSAIYDENCPRRRFVRRHVLRGAGAVPSALRMHAAVNAPSPKAKTPRRKVPGRAVVRDPARFARSTARIPNGFATRTSRSWCCLRCQEGRASADRDEPSRPGRWAEDEDGGAMRCLRHAHPLQLVASSGRSTRVCCSGAAAADMAASDTPDRGRRWRIAPVPSIKSQFKQVFHNISEVMTASRAGSASCTASCRCRAWVPR